VHGLRVEREQERTDQIVKHEDNCTGSRLKVWDESYADTLFTCLVS